jgi:uncharacterized protein
MGRNATQPTPTLGPVTENARIVSLDALRGVAILGILVMNIPYFSMVSAAANPIALGPLNMGEYVVWYVGYVFCNFKFISIFSMLFGAGIVLMTERREEAGKSSLGIHYRRMAVLLFLGLVHAYAFWYGDILYTYAMCGFVAYWFRKWSPRWLFILGLMSIAIGSLISVATGLSMSYWPEESIHELNQGWAPTAETIESEVKIYRSGWLGQMPHRLEMSIFLQSFVFLFLFVWRCGGMILMGMALYKWGVFSAAKSKLFYRVLVAMALLVGVPVIVFGIHWNEAHEWAVTSSKFLGNQFNYWASLLVALGWVGVVMLLCQHASGRRLMGPFAAVGRMALTNYFMQTVICTLVFYGHGLGLFGEVNRVEQLGFVAAIFAFQLVFSPLWLRHFNFGPMEWLWRCATYMRLRRARILDSIP